MIRVGTVGYLNARPLTDHLDRERYAVVTAIPSEIARALDAGELDVALVPVAAVLARPDFRIAGGYCIGADGPVGSVLLVAESPIEEWRSVVLDGASRTSALLAQVLLEGPLRDRMSRKVSVIEGPGKDVAAHARRDVAALVIGDPARTLPDRLTTRIDLAEVWTRWTRLPFVFAVWAGRADLPAGVRRDLARAGEVGIAEIPERYAGADRAYLSGSIRYPLDDTALVGLRRFAAIARRDGYVESDRLEFYAPAEVRSEVGADWVSWPITALAMAAKQRRELLFPGGAVTYRVGSPKVPSTTRTIDLTGLNDVERMVRLRAAANAPAVRIELRGDIAEQGSTAVDYLRWVAIGRLCLSGHLIASWESQGPHAAQAALHAGCDDLGVVPSEPVHVEAGAGSWTLDLADFERAIRAAGFEPLRRDEAWQPVGSALTHRWRRRGLVSAPDVIRE